nr:glycine--tRNA ligase, chloroplastic/mitochondrial 2 isoform X2 [Tanacetum cinerariifolium]
IERSNDLAKGVDGCLVMQSSLLNEVVNLVEAPVPVLGKFSESFLHQKYFALTDDKGNLLPYYIAVKEFLIYVDVDTLLSHA